MPIFDPSEAIPLTGTASLFSCVRYHRDREGNDRFELLPYIAVHSIHYSEGVTVPSAQFSYVLADFDTEWPFPKRVEELWPLSTSNPYAIKADDEILVYEFVDDGNRYMVFDGFASLPQVNMEGGLNVSFTAAGVGLRMSDSPVRGSFYRDHELPQTGVPIDTDLPAYFNPQNKPNKTPDGHDISQGDATAWPCFLDTTTFPKPDFWTLGPYVRYLCQTQNPDETWVKNPRSPTGDTIDDYLKSAAPKDGAPYMDLTDSSTYDLKPIVIRSYIATGHTLPEALVEQLEYAGFHFCFNCRENQDTGEPINETIVFRVDGRDGNAPIELFYPQNRARLDADLPNFVGMGLVRDHVSPANEYLVETSEVEYEVSVVLAPGFTITAGDSNDVMILNSFHAAAIHTAAASQKNKYRYFVFDEDGVGHWNRTSFVTGQATDLDDVLGHPDPETGERKYVHRARPGANTVFFSDELGRPYRAELAFSRNYSGPVPGIWDRTADWQSLADSGWKMEHDRLAIRLTCDNPEHWMVPKAEGSTAAAGDVLRVVKSLADPDAQSPYFVFRLTTVIKGDFGIDAEAAKRDASPMKYAVRRIIESKDHWVKHVAHKSSAFNTTKDNLVIRDDTDKAKAHVESLRLASEFPSIAGPITVPWITHAYGIGDSVSKILGREIDLKENAGGPSGEGPRYPFISAFSWTCQNPQTTTLKLSDRRGETELASHGFGRSR